MPLATVLWVLASASPALAQSPSYDFVVAKDGSGDFQTVQAAVDAATAERSAIYVEDGAYREKLVISEEKSGLTLTGESAEGTIITYDDYAGKGDIGTSTSFTARIAADDVQVRQMTFRNTAGRVGQAVAMLVDGNRVAFHDCRFVGNQDTLYLKPGGARQYFAGCYIEGTTDFIFGGATAVFEGCRIHSKKDSYVTAASTPEEEPFGFVFLDCALTASDEARAVYLGRPWRNHARTVFIRTEMGAHVRPEGWHNWSKPEAEETAFYAEYESDGPGAAGADTRVAWSKQLSESEAARYTKARIFAGGDADWYQSRGEQVSWGEALDQDADWYRRREARRIAENVLLYQHENGGWPKNTDMARMLSEAEQDRIRKKQSEAARAHTTIDNGATYTPLRYLARVHEATEEPRFAAAFRRGVDYLLAAQYENGGWPQYYPLREGYYENVTFNDGAMIGAMRLLRDVAQGRFAFVGASRKERAAAALEKGLDVILKTQVEVDGRRTAWAAQYDPASLRPAGARSYEPPSLSGGESVGVTRYLMEIDEPGPEVVRAVEAAVAWLERVQLTGVRIVEVEAPSLPGGRDRVVTFDPMGGAPLWARFYEIGTNYPLFLDRDGNVYHAYSQISRERRMGYQWFGSWARDLLEEDYPAWRERQDAE